MSNTATYVALPSTVLKDRRLKPADIVVYCALRSYANQERKSWPSQARIANDVGRCVRSVRLSIRRLETCGHLDVELTWDGRNRRCIYRFGEVGRSPKMSGHRPGTTGKRLPVRSGKNSTSSTGNQLPVELSPDISNNAGTSEYRLSRRLLALQAAHPDRRVKGLTLLRQLRPELSGRQGLIADELLAARSQLDLHTIVRRLAEGHARTSSNNDHVSSVNSPCMLSESRSRPGGGPSPARPGSSPLVEPSLPDRNIMIGK